MNPGDTATAGGEQVTILEISPKDGWIKVLYADGDTVWTPPAQVLEVSTSRPSDIGGEGVPHGIGHVPVPLPEERGGPVTGPVA